MDKNSTLFIDLDGTLIKTDILFESLFALLKLNILYIFFLTFWLLRGKAHLKNEIAKRANIDVKLLPYNEELLDYLKKEKNSGRSIILATASNIKYANEIAKHLELFSDIIASNEQINYSGAKKLKKINELAADNFSYAGNANIDLKIFEHAKTAIIVNPSSGLIKKTEKLTQLELCIENRKGFIKTTAKAMRLHQWIKNILLFVPLLTAQTWHQIDHLLLTLAGFLLFGLTASSVYLLNDLLDLEADRIHPRKRNRPLASGNMSIPTAVVLLILLPLFTFTISFVLFVKFFYVLAIYLFITLLYSFFLKTYVLIDVITLASLYTIRVIAGAVITNIELSFWLLAFSMFIFISLALVKRCSELHTLKNEGEQYTEGRDYNVTDLPALQSMGLASGYTSILVIALFINSQEVIMRYSHPEVLWLLCPALLYWISRVWIKTQRDEMHDDPIVFSIKDRGSQFVAVSMGIIVLLAI